MWLLSSLFAPMVSGTPLRQIMRRMLTGQFASAAATPAGRCDNSIVRCVSMTTRAMGFASIMGRPSITAQHILAMRYWLQVISICTWRIIAEVIKLFPFGNRADQEFVGDTMNRQAAASHTNLSVAVPVSVPPPYPTTVRLWANALKQAAYQPHIIHTWSLS